MFNTLAQGFWVFTSYDGVREMYQRTDLFSTESVTAWNPEPHFSWLPLGVDPPEHASFRRLMNPWFSPAAVRRNADEQRRICRRYIEELVPSGRCDAVAEFAIRYPTEVFLGLMNLPAEDTEMLVQVVEDFFLGYSGAAPELAGSAYARIKEYFGTSLAERRARPRDPEFDILTYLVQATVAPNGEPARPLTEDELLDLCFMLVVAGLDTTRAQIGWMLYHFATHPEDRRRVLDDPALVVTAVEEVLRYYTIIYGDGRKVTRDEEYQGCPLKKGDMVYGMTSAANRDRRYTDPDLFVLDRKPTPNLAFAAGPHRCLGAHLARSELQVALEEWLRAIPDFHVDTDEPLVERGAQLSLTSLPLAWPVDRTPR
ncbi:cytochrome P450 [Pseudonocardia xishanensis]|uniref:cytochrome P450 n=1 Tax=Pseudonocardia xishanensis TaxID=630995 RepID=UPI0031E5E3A1